MVVKKENVKSLSTVLCSLPTERYETEIEINMKSASFSYISHTQFPLTLAWACTIQKYKD